MRIVAGLCALIALACLAGAGPAGAAAAAQTGKRTSESLLFADVDFQRLLAAREQSGTTAPTATAVGTRSASLFSNMVIHLSAILYDGPDDWRVWLNGQPLTPRSPASQIEIVQVSPHTVALRWHRGLGRASVPIELRPNQSFVAATGAIVEGSGPVVSSKGGD